MQQDPRRDTPSSLAYLDKLQATHLDDVLKEPSLISSEATRVETDLTNLCYREYPLFISVHQCSTAVRNAFDDFDGSLTRLLDSVPDLETECKSFATSTQRLQSGRRRAGLLLEYQDKINELLQMPKLMETCVRNGYYQDAIDISDHAQQLDQTSKLVQDVLTEITAIRQLMMVQLVTLLRESIKLPTLIKTVSFIRRLGMNEAELRVVYLTSRLHNFNAHVGELDKSEPIRYIRRYIDLFREHIYDIITQFTAIFDHDLLLVSFANDSVTNLVTLVLGHLPQVSDSAALSSLLVQLGYCAISFSRLGLDFSSHFVEPFSGYISESYRQGVAKATEVMRTGLEQSLQSSASLSLHLVTPEFNPSEDLAFPEHSLPPHVTQLPPLATFVNAHLSALNVLRLLAPRHLARRLQALQAAQLEVATESVFDYLEHAVANPVVARERFTHGRSNSSPKAQLLRRNTETLLSPAERTAKRRRSLQIYALFGRSWVASMRYLQAAMARDIFGLEHLPVIPSLDDGLQRTQIWTEDSAPANGVDRPIARDLSESFEHAPPSPQVEKEEPNSPPVANEGDVPHADATPGPIVAMLNGRGHYEDATESVAASNGNASATSPLRGEPASPAVESPKDAQIPLGQPSSSRSDPDDQPGPSTAIDAPVSESPALPSSPSQEKHYHADTPQTDTPESGQDVEVHIDDALVTDVDVVAKDEAGREAHPDLTLENGEVVPESSTPADVVDEGDAPENGDGLTVPNDTAASGPTSKKKKKRNKKR